MTFDSHQSTQSLQASFIQSALEAHNECRLRRHVEPLIHNPELSKRAQQHADFLAQMGQRNFIFFSDHVSDRVFRL